MRKSHQIHSFGLKNKLKQSLNLAGKESTSILKKKCESIGSKKEALDLLVSMSEDQTDLQVYVKEGESDEKISSILMFSSGVSNAVPKAHLKGINIETVLLLIEGDLTLENMGKLISRMNLPGGAQLKKAGI